MLAGLSHIQAVRASPMSRGRPATPPGEHGKINLTKTPNGWKADGRVRTYTGKRKRIHTTARTKTEAITKFKQRAKQEANTSDYTTTTPTTPLTTHLNQWLTTTATDRATATQQLYKQTIHTHIAPAIGDLTLQELTTPLLDHHIQALTPGIGKSARAILNQALRDAVIAGALRTNPVRDTHTIRQPNPPKKRALTPHELAAYRALVKDFQQTSPTGRTRAPAFLNIVDFLAGTGVRVSEALTLKWEAITLDTTPPTAIIVPTKDHGRSKRVIQLPTIASRALQRQRALSSPRYTPYVFGTLPKQTHIPKSSVERWFREVRAYWHSWAGLDGYKPNLDWVTPHTFRYTVATWIAETKGEYFASQHLGHANTTTTRHHYIDMPRQGVPVVDLLDRLAEGD